MEPINKKRTKQISFSSVLDPINIKGDKKSKTSKTIVQVNLDDKEKYQKEENNKEKNFDEKSEKSNDLNMNFNSKKSSKKIPEYPKSYGKTSKNLINVNKILKNSEIDKKKIIKLDEEFLNRCNLYKTPIEKLNFNKKDIVITYYVDGNLTDGIYKLLQEKLSKNNNGIKIIFSYIYSTYIEDIDLNYRHKRENIIFFINDKFKDNDRKKLYFSPQISQVENYTLDNSEIYYEQFADFSRKMNSNFLTVTYESLKGYRGNEEILQIYLDFILREIYQPIIILKQLFFTDEELLIPDKTKNKKANWLFVFNLDHKNSFTILETFMDLIDPSIDNVTGLSLIPAFISKDDFEMNFLNKMKQEKVNEFSYISKEYEKEPNKIINDFVNEAEIIYDFVVLFNKKKHQKQKYVDFEDIYISNLNVINNCESNICIVTGI